MRIAYFVHDLGDPAVHRRVRMLRQGGASITLLGFWRMRLPETEVPSQILGRTRDGKFLQRCGAVLRAMVTLPSWRGTASDTDIIIARQLEMLVLGWMTKILVAPDARLVYECLDIHRLMLRRGVIGRLLRGIERRLLRASDCLMISSEAYLTEYFLPAHQTTPRVELVENKVLQNEIDDIDLAGQSRHGQAEARPPWRIGWFGMIRCRRSLLILAELARTLNGEVEILICGHVASDTVPDLDAIIEQTPGMRYGGPYDRRTDLARLYRSVHFFWAIDFSDGEASNWLLPNRLYEGGLFCCIPIAMRNREVGRWLGRHRAGVLLDELEPDLVAFFENLDIERYLSARQAIADIPTEAFLHDDAICDALTSRLLFATA